MAVITIPSDYDERTHAHVIPICIADVDKKGNQVSRLWIDHGAAPAAEALIRIAHRYLADRYRASEITEFAVHSLSRVHGDDIGDRPTIMVRNRARLYAIDESVGGRRARTRQNVELYTETLESLVETFDAARHYEHVEILAKISAELEALELHHVQELLPLMLSQVSGRQLSEMYGQKANTLKKRFFRGVRLAAAQGGITWGRSSRA